VSLLASATAEDHRCYTDAAARRSRTVGYDAAPSALDPTFLDAVDAVRAFPATAHLSWDVQNSLAQQVLDALADWLVDDPDDEKSQSRALAEARQTIKVLEFRLAKAQKTAKSGGAQ
jgi:hypothetical protein